MTCLSKVNLWVLPKEYSHSVTPLSPLWRKEVNGLSLHENMINLNTWPWFQNWAQRGWRLEICMQRTAALCLCVGVTHPSCQTRTSPSERLGVFRPVLARARMMGEAWVETLFRDICFPHLDVCRQGSTELRNAKDIDSFNLFSNCLYSIFACVVFSLVVVMKINVTKSNCFLFVAAEFGELTKQIQHPSQNTGFGPCRNQQSGWHLFDLVVTCSFPWPYITKSLQQCLNITLIAPDLPLKSDLSTATFPWRLFIKHNPVFPNEYESLQLRKINKSSSEVSKEMDLL